jgi:dipeptidyl aminopeptidase/acylaminoacyl peptidase
MREAKGKRWARYPAVLQAGGTGKTADAILRITGEARDPAAALSRVRCPVLAIYGELDQMVRVDENSVRLEKALRAGGASDVSVVIVPGADHAFFPTKTGGHEELVASASGRIVFAPGFLEQMTGWLSARVVGRQEAR